MNADNGASDPLRKMGEAGFEFARQFELEGLLAEFERELVKLVGETTAEDEGKADSEGP